MVMIETLEPVLVLLGCGIASVLVLPRFGISPIVGFLVAGIAVGHHGLGLIPHNETIHLLAELGVVFLLFDIGLHFSLRHVWQERKGIFVYGPLQVFITAGIFYLIGAQFGLEPDINIVLALALALSSTAVVSQVINDKGVQGTPNSNTAIAILIFQDICAIFLLILAGTLGSDGGSSLGYEIGMALLKCAASFGVALLIGKYLLKPIFKWLIHYNNTEVFTMIALFLVLVTGTATGAIGLSLTLGAFLAGMIISETPFKHIIQTELKPFRFLLLGFFFVTVGMGIDYHVIFESWVLVLGMTASITLIKAATIFALFMGLGEKFSNSIQQSALLFQGSEFLFVVIAAPAIADSLGSTLLGALVVSVAISMALTSFMFDAARKMALKSLDQDDSEPEDSITMPQLVIVGMNDIGHTVARAMQRFDIAYMAVEHDYDRFLNARLQGFPVIYGDKADIRFWETVGVEHFRHVVIVDPDMELAKRYGPIFRERFPKVKRYIAARSHEDYVAYEKLKNITVLSLGVPPGLEISERVLSDIGIAVEDIAAWIAKEQKSYLNGK